MNKDKLLKLLEEKDQSVEKVEEQNPYSQDDLSKFINNTGFAVDQVPRLSELAKLLNKEQIPIDMREEDKKETKNPLTTVKKHLSEAEDDSDKQLSIRALKKLIAKYKGEE